MGGAMFVYLLESLKELVLLQDAVQAEVVPVIDVLPQLVHDDVELLDGELALLEAHAVVALPELEFALVGGLLLLKALPHLGHHLVHLVEALPLAVEEARGHCHPTHALLQHARPPQRWCLLAALGLR